MKSKKSQASHQISLRLSSNEYAELCHWREQLGLNNKALLLQSLQLAAQHGLLKPQADIQAPSPQQTVNLTSEQAAQLLAAEQQGELFCFAHKQPFLLLAVELDPATLPEWNPLQLTPLKDFPTAEAALKSYCKEGAGHPGLAQIVLLRKASQAQLGFTPEPDHWYYPAHIMLELYPRIMYALGDQSYYEALLMQYYLDDAEISEES